MGFPINPPGTAIVDQHGRVTSEWFTFFLNIQKIIGGPSNPFDDSSLLLPSGSQTAAALSLSKQDQDDTLDALAALDSSTGLLAQTGADTFAKRTLTAPAAGFSITNPAGVAGDPAFVLANDLAALEGLASTGIAARTAADTWAQRTITAGSAKISVANGSGAAGNPTIDLGSVASTDLSNSANIALLNGGQTFSADISVPDEAYGAGWNGSVEVPTKNAIYDKIETVSGGGVAWTLVDQTGAAAAGSSTWTHSADVAAVDVIGLSAYNELLILAIGVSTAVGGNVRYIRASVDNGSSFISGASDYTDVPISGSATGTSFFMNHGTNSTAARSVVGHIKNLKGPDKQAIFMAGTTRHLVNASDINAIRLGDSAGANMTAGTLYVYAR